MKKLLVGVAAVALLAPGAALAGDGHDHACIDDACTVFELFQTPAAAGGASGWQGTEAPKYGTWGFDLSGRDGAAITAMRTSGSRRPESTSELSSGSGNHAAPARYRRMPRE